MKYEYDHHTFNTAYIHSSMHRAEIEKSQLCGCFYCCEIYESKEIRKWTDNGETALCPRCGIDSVIGDAAPYLIESKFLAFMHDEWFRVRN